MMTSPSPQSPPIQGGEGGMAFDTVGMAASLLPLEGGRTGGGGGMITPPSPQGRGRKHRL
jgi:hypothetical protein